MRIQWIPGLPFPPPPSEGLGTRMGGSDNLNGLTEKIVPVVTEYLQNNRTLTELQLPKNLTSIEEVVNDMKKRNGLPFKLTGRSIHVPLK